MRILFVILLIVGYSCKINAQVVQKESNKYQLKKGVRLESKVISKPLTNKINAKGISLIRHKNISKKNRKIPKKPIKVLKYSLNKKDDE